jgi:hypothetical protein
MKRLNPEKLRNEFLPGTTPESPVTPRRYTLTHSDRTGELFLCFGLDYNQRQISGWYTRRARSLTVTFQTVSPDDGHNTESSRTLIYDLDTLRKSLSGIRWTKLAWLPCFLESAPRTHKDNWTTMPINEACTTFRAELHVFEPS